MSRGRSAAIDRIRHIIEAAEMIARYAAAGRAVFESDSKVRDAILYQIIVIGETAKAVVTADASIPQLIPNVERSLWARMRDRVTHQYWATDDEIVWLTASLDVPELRAVLEQRIPALLP